MIKHRYGVALAILLLTVLAVPTTASAKESVKAELIDSDSLKQKSSKQAVQPGPAAAQSTNIDFWYPPLCGPGVPVTVDYIGGRGNTTNWAFSSNGISQASGMVPYLCASTTCSWRIRWTPPPGHTITFGYTTNNPGWISAIQVQCF